MSHITETDRQKAEGVIEQLGWRMEIDEDYSSPLTKEDKDFIWAAVERICFVRHMHDLEEPSLSALSDELQVEFDEIHAAYLAAKEKVGNNSRAFVFENELAYAFDTIGKVVSEAIRKI